MPAFERVAPGDLYFGQPFDTETPTTAIYESLSDQPLPSPEQLLSGIERPQLERFLRTHHTRLSRWDLMSYIELDPNAIDTDALTEDDLHILETVLKVEANDPVYTRKLLDHFKDDLHGSNFLVIWGYEEFKHYYAFQAYLAKAWAIRHLRATRGPGPFSEDDLAPVLERAHTLLDEKAARVRQNGEAVWGVPAEWTGLQVCGYTALQELITHVFYKLAANRVQEPILRGLLRKVAGDEMAHHVVYNQAVDQMLAADPERVPELARAYGVFEMPNNALLQDGDRRNREIGEYLSGSEPVAGRRSLRHLLTFIADKIGDEAAVEALAPRQDDAPPSMLGTLLRLPSKRGQAERLLRRTLASVRRKAAAASGRSPAPAGVY